MASPLIILDRDGVINEDSDNYIKSVDEWVPIPGSIEAIAQLSRAGWQIAVATNQSGLSQQLFDLDDLEAMHAKLCTLVEAQGGHIDAIFYCPHLPDEQCDCRKPKPGLLDAIARELDINLRGSIFVGDSLKDLQAGEAKHCRCILVRTGKGMRTLQQIAADPHWSNVEVFDDLNSVAQHLLAQDQP